MEDNFDVDKFSKLIHARESIWNYKSKAYTNKAQRKDDWVSVCEAMVSDFETKLPEEKENIALELQAKWKVLRDGFTRSLKNYKANKGKLYVYFEQLNFLYGLHEAVLDSATDSKKVTQRRKRSAQDSSEINEEPADKKTPEPNKPNVVKSATTDIDQDEQFLLSLLTDFRKISEDHKLDAKGDIINVIRHYKNKNPTHFKARDSYYSNNISGIPNSAIGGPTSHISEEYEFGDEEFSQDSCSPIEIKFIKDETEIISGT